MEKALQFHYGRMGKNQTYRKSLRSKSRTRKHGEVWDHMATAQHKSHDPKHQRTNTERAELWVTWRRSSNQLRTLFSLSADSGTFSRWRKTPRKSKTKETLERKEYKSPFAQKRLGSMTLSSALFFHVVSFVVRCMFCRFSSRIFPLNTHIFTDGHFQAPRHTLCFSQQLLNLQSSRANFGPSFRLLS